MPRSRCSSLSCHTVFPEQEHTVLSSFDAVSIGDLDMQSYIPRGYEVLTVPHASASRNNTDQCVWVILVELQNVSHQPRKSAINLAYLAILLLRNNNASANHLPNLNRPVQEDGTNATLAYLNSAKDTSTWLALILGLECFPDTTSRLWTLRDVASLTNSSMIGTW